MKAQQVHDTHVNLISSNPNRIISALKNDYSIDNIIMSGSLYLFNPDHNSNLPVHNNIITQVDNFLLDKYGNIIFNEYKCSDTPKNRSKAYQQLSLMKMFHQVYLNQWFKSMPILTYSYSNLEFEKVE